MAAAITDTENQVNLPCWDSAEVDPEANFEGVTSVFGYGSLVWKPPCDARHIVGSQIGCIKGWARRFWQHSVDHRGTPTAPGRVATILHHTHPDMAAESTAAVDGSNDCFVTAGMVYTISDIAAILPELDFREKNGYTRTVVDVYDPKDLTRKIDRAIMYYAKPGRDPAYLGRRTNEDIAATAATAVGPSGPNTEYIFNLDQWCGDNDISDLHVAEVARLTRERMP